MTASSYRPDESGKLQLVRAYFPNPPSEEMVDDLRARLGLVCDVVTSSQPDDYELLIEGRPSDSMLQVSSLKTLVVPFAGVPDATLQLLRKYPHISGYNLHHNAADTAEVAVALLFAAAKLIVPIDQRLRRNDWGSRYEDSCAVALEGKKTLILGYGQIGQRIARILLATGMEVSAIRRTAKSDPLGIVQVHSIESLRDRLPRVDALVIALPQTAETLGLIGKNELDLLPRGAILVNIARGAIVDEEALYNALKSGHLHSAGLDVWYQYPQASANTVPGYFQAPDSASNTPPSKFPFGQLDNVVMSPHRAGTSMDTEPRRARDLAALILAVSNGEQAPSKIDLAAGY